MFLDLKENTQNEEKGNGTCGKKVIRTSRNKKAWNDKIHCICLLSSKTHTLTSRYGENKLINNHKEKSSLKISKMGTQYQDFKYIQNLNTEIQGSSESKGRIIEELMVSFTKFVEKTETHRSPICSTNPQ